MDKKIFGDIKKRRELIYLSIIFLLLIAFCILLFQVMNQNEGYNDLNSYSTIISSPTIFSSKISGSESEKTDIYFTETPNAFTIIPIATIGVTQKPVEIPLQLSFTEKYLYLDVNVTFTLGLDNPAIGYINLDDPQDNGMKNSDIGIFLEKDKLNSFILKPVNGAKDYIPDEALLAMTPTITVTAENAKIIPLSYSFCFSHLSDYANFWGTTFVSGNPICVLTNENRIAIVSFIPNSIKYNDDGTTNISLSFSVFREQINQ